MSDAIQRRVRHAARRVPPGRWGVGVSGGADSVATLRALARRDDLELAVLHVDHAARPGSAEDAQFVRELADALSLPFHLDRLDGLRGESAWRRARLNRFRDAAETRGLAGIVLGHHADDLAETVAMRLLRGSPRSGTMGLSPLARTSRVAGVTLLRPMLGVRRRELRATLGDLPFRTDPTNAEPITLRNRLRPEMDDRLVRSLLRLSVAAVRAEAALDGAADCWPDEPPAVADAQDPRIRRSARQWLRERGVPEAEATPGRVDTLLSLLDGTGPRVVELPGRLRVKRIGRHRGGGFEVTRPADHSSAGAAEERG